MKIKDITEGMWSNIGKNIASGFASGTNLQATTLNKKQQELKNRQNQLDKAKQAMANFSSQQDDDNGGPPLSATSPATDIKDTLDDDTQYRFPNPDYPGVQIIVRKSGWYIDRLPPEKRGQIKRDSATGLYPVVIPANITKYNQYYNQAAEANKVKEEPAHAL